MKSIILSVFALICLFSLPSCQVAGPSGQPLLTVRMAGGGHPPHGMHHGGPIRRPMPMMAGGHRPCGQQHMMGRPMRPQYGHGGGYNRPQQQGYNHGGYGGYGGGYQQHRPMYNNMGAPLNHYGNANGSRASMLGQQSNMMGFEEWRARASQGGAHYGTRGY